MDSGSATLCLFALTEIMAKKKDPYQQIMANIDWNRILLTIIPILQPVLIFGGWYIFSRMDKRADALSKLIAVTEPIPAVDLNLPSAVVLASLYHSLEEAMSFWPEIPEPVKEFFDTEVQKPKEGETWQQFIERRLRETGLFSLF